jgi:hypothetical protein
MLEILILDSTEYEGNSPYIWPLTTLKRTTSHTDSIKSERQQGGIGFKFSVEEIVCLFEIRRSAV